MLQQVGERVSPPGECFLKPQHPPSRTKAAPSTLLTLLRTSGSSGAPGRMGIPTISRVRSLLNSIMWSLL